MSDKHASKAEKFRLLQEAFRSQLSLRLATIRHTLTEADPRPDEDQAINEIYREIHNLVGSAGTFGYHQFSICARNFERMLLDYKDTALGAMANSTAVNCALTELETLAEKGPDEVG